MILPEREDKERTRDKRKQRGQVSFYRQMRLTVRGPPAMTSLEYPVKHPNLTPLFSPTPGRRFSEPRDSRS
jgi:hypothetical protein